MTGEYIIFLPVEKGELGFSSSFTFLPYLIEHSEMRNRRMFSLDYLEKKKMFVCSSSK